MSAYHAPPVTEEPVLRAGGTASFYEHWEQDISRISKLSIELKNAARWSADFTYKTRDLGRELKGLSDTTRTIGDRFLANGRVEKSLLDTYKQHTTEIKRLSTEYKGLKALQEALNRSTMTNLEKFKAASEGFANVSRSIKGLASQIGGLTGLSFGIKSLTTTLLDYNKVVFEGMRVGERYGDSIAKFNSALATVKSSTALSKQEFAELNAMFKQTYLGLKPTSTEVLKLATAMSGRLGWAGEQLKAKFGELLSIQSKLPSLFDRIVKVQDEFAISANRGAEAALALSNRLSAIGASREDIEKVMSAVSSPSMDLSDLMNFEKIIARSRRDIQNTNLEIAQKMRPALEAVVQITGKFADILAKTPASVTAAVAAAGVLTVAFGGVLNMVKGIEAGLAVVQARAIAASMSTGAFAGRGALALGGGLLAAGAIGYGAEKWGNKEMSSIGPGMSTAEAGWKGAGVRGLGGLATGAAAGAGIGLMYGRKFGWKGAAAGAVIGGLVGAGRGVIEGRSRVGDLTAQNREQVNTQSFDAKQMAGIAKSWDVKGVQAPSDEELKTVDGIRKARQGIIEAIQKETDESKANAAISRLIAEKLVDRAEVEKMLTKSGKDDNKVKEEANRLITQAVGGVESLFNRTQQVQAAMEGVTKELQTQLDMANSMAELGTAAGEAFEKGLIGDKTGRLLMDIGLGGAKDAAEIAGQQVVATLASSFASSPKIMKALFSGDAMAEAAMAGMEDVGKEIQERSLKIAELGRKRKATSDITGGTPGEREDREKTLQGIQKEIDEELKLRQDAQDKLTRGIKIKGLDKFDSAAATEMIEDVKKQIEKMKSALSSGEEFTLDIGVKVKGDELRDAIKNAEAGIVKMNQSLKTVIDANIRAATLPYKIIEETTGRDIGVQEKLLSLAEARSDIASKMGIPQSYQALKDQIETTNELLNQEKERLRLQIEQSSKFKVSENDINDLVEKRIAPMTVVDNIAKRTGAGAEQHAEIERDLYATISAVVPQMTKITGITGKLAELTKSWREGWIDAMEEQVINAGDFAAVIGTTRKNVPEVIAAGAPDTFRAGAINRRILSEYELQQVRYGEAGRFGSSFVGQTSGFGKTPNGIHGNILGANANQVDVQRNAQAAITPVSGSSTPWQAEAANQAARVMGAGNASANVQTGPGGMNTGQVWDQTTRSMIPIGAEGGSPVAFGLPQGVTPPFKEFGGDVDRFGAAVGQLVSVVGTFGEGAGTRGTTVTSAAPAAKSRGGIVRMAGGGMVGGGTIKKMSRGGDDLKTVSAVGAASTVLPVGIGLDLNKLGYGNADLLKLKHTEIAKILRYNIPAHEWNAWQKISVSIKPGSGIKPRGPAKISKIGRGVALAAAQGAGQLLEGNPDDNLDIAGAFLTGISNGGSGVSDIAKLAGVKNQYGLMAAGMVGEAGYFNPWTAPGMASYGLGKKYFERSGQTSKWAQNLNDYREAKKEREIKEGLQSRDAPTRARAEQAKRKRDSEWQELADADFHIKMGERDRAKKKAIEATLPPEPSDADIAAKEYAQVYTKGRYGKASMSAEHAPFIGGGPDAYSYGWASGSVNSPDTYGFVETHGLDSYSEYSKHAGDALVDATDKADAIAREKSLAIGDAKRAARKPAPAPASKPVAAPVRYDTHPRIGGLLREGGRHVRRMGEGNPNIRGIGESSSRVQQMDPIIRDMTGNAIDLQQPERGQVRERQQAMRSGWDSDHGITSAAGWNAAHSITALHTPTKKGEGGMVGIPDGAFITNQRSTEAAINAGYGDLFAGIVGGNGPLGVDHPSNTFPIIGGDGMSGGGAVELARGEGILNPANAWMGNVLNNLADGGPVSSDSRAVRDISQATPRMGDGRGGAGGNFSGEFSLKLKGLAGEFFDTPPMIKLGSSPRDN